MRNESRSKEDRLKLCVITAVVAAACAILISGLLGCSFGECEDDSDCPSGQSCVPEPSCDSGGYTGYNICTSNPRNPPCG
jgi:hypothetical protein